MNRRFSSALLATTAFALALSVAAPDASAAKSSAAGIDAATLAKLQEQISALQSEISALKAAQTKTETKVQATSVALAESTKAQAATGVAATADTAPKAGSVGDKLQASIQDKTGVKVSLGGYADLTAIFRNQNQNADTGSNWNNSVPYASNKNAHQGEFRFSARNTRVTLNASAKPDEVTDVSAYIETDFAGTGVTSSETQTSNYSPRLRQAFATYENKDWGTHLLAGQAYSLATMGSEGMLPKKEALPVGLDSGLVPGYVYTRTAQLRAVQDFADKKVWAGLSIESPETNYGGLTIPSVVTTEAATQINGTPSTTVPNLTSDDVAPDVVGKVAFDPGWGHYELFGIGRIFHDRTASSVYGGGHNNYALGGGGGASMFLKLVPKKLEMVGSFMAGKGIGRYSAGQLPDVVFSPSGDIVPVTQFTGYTGFIGHPTPTWDLFAYAGIEQAMRENIPGTNTGYGNFDLLTGCYSEGVGTCSAQTQRIWQVTGGAWKTVYSGNFGNVKLGLQNSLTRKDAFSGAGNKQPHAYENVTLTSIRYTPSF